MTNVELHIADTLVCDFCSSPHLFARYPAKDFVSSAEVHGLKMASKGDWAACKPCAELIEAAKWNELLERSVATFAKKYGPLVPAPMLRNFIADAHRQFREQRIMQ